MRKPGIMFEVEIEITAGKLQGQSFTFLCSGTIEEIYHFIYKVQNSLYCSNYVKSFTKISDKKSSSAEQYTFSKYKKITIPFLYD